MNKAVVVFKIMIFLSSLGLVACDGGGGSTTVTTATPPEVTSTSPTNNSTGVLTNSTLSVIFSVDMDATTVTTSNFSLSGASTVSGSIAYNAATRTATFTPDAPLKANTSYTASLTTSIADSAGTSLATVYQLQFTTETFIRRVSVDSSETEATNDSRIPNVSNDGRYVVFTSLASNLVSGDTNNKDDIFIRDTQDGTTTRVSVSTASAESNGNSSDPVISGDGRYVVFQSDATNLVAMDTNTKSDIFIHDTQNSTTDRVSISDSEVEANNGSASPAISADGRYVTFVSSATNLVTDDTNAQNDIFVRDIQSNGTVRVSVSDTEVQSNNASSKPSISSDGRYVAFASTATNLVVSDANAKQDIFVRDTQLNATVRVSVKSDGSESNGNSDNPNINGNGRYIAFTSVATDLVANDTNTATDVFVHDTQTSNTTRVSISNSASQADDGSFEPHISSDGRYVVFTSSATNLLASADSNGWDDVFVRDTSGNTTIRVNVDKSGVVGTGTGFSATTSTGISGDGRYIVFNTNAANLAPEGDGNDSDDVFRVLNATP